MDYSNCKGTLLEFALFVKFKDSTAYENMFNAYLLQCSQDELKMRKKMFLKQRRKDKQFFHHIGAEIRD